MKTIYKILFSICSTIVCTAHSFRAFAKDVCSLYSDIELSTNDLVVDAPDGQKTTNTGCTYNAGQCMKTGCVNNEECVAAYDDKFRYYFATESNADKVMGYVDYEMRCVSAKCKYVNPLSFTKTISTIKKPPIVV